VFGKKICNPVTLAGILIAGNWGSGIVEIAEAVLLGHVFLKHFLATVFAEFAPFWEEDWPVTFCTTLEWTPFDLHFPITLFANSSSRIWMH